RSRREETQRELPRLWASEVLDLICVAADRRAAAKGRRSAAVTQTFAERSVLRALGTWSGRSRSIARHRRGRRITEVGSVIVAVGAAVSSDNRSGVRIKTTCGAGGKRRGSSAFKAVR